MLFLRGAGHHVVAVNPQTTGVDILLMDKRRAMHVLNRHDTTLTSTQISGSDGVNLYRKTVLTAWTRNPGEEKLVAKTHHLKELKKIRGKDFGHKLS